VRGWNFPLSLTLQISLALSFHHIHNTYQECVKPVEKKRKKLKTIKERCSLVWHTIMITLNTRRQLLTAIFIFSPHTHPDTLILRHLALVIVCTRIFLQSFYRSARVFFYFQHYQSLQMIIGMKSLICLLQFP
jgi:hypothetical protein